MPLSWEVQVLDAGAFHPAPTSTCTWGPGLGRTPSRHEPPSSLCNANTSCFDTFLLPHRRVNPPENRWKAATITPVGRGTSPQRPYSTSQGSSTARPPLRGGAALQALPCHCSIYQRHEVSQRGQSLLPPPFPLTRQRAESEPWLAIGRRRLTVDHLASPGSEREPCFGSREADPGPHTQALWMF
jgi:hypothetical protein